MFKGQSKKERDGKERTSRMEPVRLREGKAGRRDKNRSEHRASLRPKKGLSFTSKGRLCSMLNNPESRKCNHLESPGAYGECPGPPTV